ncbi:hypothetical protein [Mucilaginibacter paludis]|uniref:Uncharacterized protein n=1 Tax=Mucilaginibacter paludis DSM 18603 TaxID=714943 RepID=H1YAR1_9SPHI|nr:hypothetical protein [Mucilaginibacter paludis]EHQ29520.1 hypothetical protein Mucpa_5448 [Mucilaginibacter paludis DSM 18603]
MTAGIACDGFIVCRIVYSMVSLSGAAGPALIVCLAYRQYFRLNHANDGLEHLRQGKLHGAGVLLPGGGKN